MRLKVGQTLASTVDTTTVVVVRAPQAEVEVTCGGAGMVDGKERDGAAAGTPDAGQMTGTLLGKRYADEGLGIELLCTKAGDGGLFVDGALLPLKEAKPLPASD